MPEFPLGDGDRSQLRSCCGSSKLWLFLSRDWEWEKCKDSPVTSEPSAMDLEQSTWFKPHFSHHFAVDFGRATYPLWAMQHLGGASGMWTQISLLPVLSLSATPPKHSRHLMSHFCFWLPPVSVWGALKNRDFLQRPAVSDLPPNHNSPTFPSYR